MNATERNKVITICYQHHYWPFLLSGLGFVEVTPQALYYVDKSLSTFIFADAEFVIVLSGHMWYCCFSVVCSKLFKAEKN